MASVGRIEPRPAAPREPMAAVEAARKPEQPPRMIQLDRLAHTVMDGVTVMELDPLETGKHVRRVVLRPEFRAAPELPFRSGSRTAPARVRDRFYRFRTPPN